MHDESEDQGRPLPKPPRCRGIPIGGGRYTGCFYGYGEVAPFTPPFDCPVCNGSGIEVGTRTVIPHAAFGDPDCPGYLAAIILGVKANVTCDECGAVARTVKTSALSKILNEMELTLRFGPSMCPHCRSVSLFPGYSRTTKFTCQSCGAVVKHSSEV